MDLLRLLITSWSFFDRPGDRFRTRLILYKGDTPILERGWPETVDFKWWRLVFNPAGNDYHYSKQLETQAALLSQKHPSDVLLRSREFRKYLDHISESVGPSKFDTMSVLLEVKKHSTDEGYQKLVSLTLPITDKAASL